MSHCLYSVFSLLCFGTIITVLIMFLNIFLLAIKCFKCVIIIIIKLFINRLCYYLLVLLLYINSIVNFQCFDSYTSIFTHLVC